MGVFGKLLKNTIVGTATAGYGLYKAAADAIEEQVDLAKIEALEDNEAAYNETVKHFTPEERQKMEQLSKAYSMADIAKRSAKDKNKLASLRFKYGVNTKQIPNN